MDKQIKEADIDKPFLMMTLILSLHQCHKFVRIAKKKDIRGGIVVLGRGTVKSATLSLLGIKSQKKEVVNIIVEKGKAKEVQDFLTEELMIHEPGHGILYTTPIVTAGQIVNSRQDIWDKEQFMEGKSMFKKLTVVVNRGMAEDVMDIARKSGIKGGTILHGRGTGSDFTERFFGMEIEPEKELVIILMPSDLVEKVVNDLYKELKLDVPGNGILFVEPVLDVRGLFDLQNSNKDSK